MEVDEEFRRNGFEREFRKAQSPWIIYRGLTIWSDHQFPVGDGQRVRITIESFDSDWDGLGKEQALQGVGLTIDKKIVFNGMSCSILTIWPYPPPAEGLRPLTEELRHTEFGSVHTEGGIKHRLCLWLDEPFRPVEIVVHTREGHIHIWNAWQFVGGLSLKGIHSGHYGAGMLVEEIENGFRYRCNDGYPDLDFNDIVFRVERCEK